MNEPNESGAPARCGGGPLPTFGPFETQGGVDELEPAVAVVQVAFALTRTQLATALGISFAGIAADRTAESLTDDEVRTEVEGQLAAEALHELDLQIERDQARTWPPEQQRVLDVLAAAVDRAFTRPEEPQRIVQRPRYGDGVVTLQTEDQGQVTVPEPAWCVGHDGDTVGAFVDITHRGAPTTTDTVTARYGVLNILEAQLTHSPHAVTQPEPLPLLDVHVDVQATVAPEDGQHLVQALRVASLRLERALRDLDRIRRGQS